MKTWALRIVLIAALVGVAMWLRGRGPQNAVPPDAASSPRGSRRGTDWQSVLPRRSNQGEPGASATNWGGPSRVVNDFFQAAGDGDDDAYLRLVDGQLRRTLEQNRAELGADAFRKSLRRSAAGIKGLAVTPAKDTSDATVALDVEIVFADRNEYQRMVLAPKGRGWVITTIDQARRIEPVVPYGTPVFEEASSENKENPNDRTVDGG